jgi:hypothetical protein
VRGDHSRDDVEWIAQVKRLNVYQAEHDTTEQHK